MKSGSEKKALDGVGLSDAFIWISVLSVLLSTAILLIKILWTYPLVLAGSLLILMLAFAAGIYFTYCFRLQQESALNSRWRYLMFSALGLLLLIPVGFDDWRVMLPGIIISGMGLGSTYGVVSVRSKRPGFATLHLYALALVCLSVTATATLLAASYLSPSAAVAISLDFTLLAAVLTWINEND